jgi:hypothetical protein
MKRLLFFLVLVLAVAIFSPLPVSAQTEQPPTDTTVEVLGRIVNGTEGGTVPEGLTVMLHTWDQSFAERGMLHTESGPEGRFSFQDVAVEPGLVYAVMVLHDGAAYVSEPVVALEGEGLPLLEVAIYESTSDPATVQVDSLHLFFSFGQGGLAVGEVYSLSNRGERTVAGAVTLEDGTKVTLEFPLPESAANVAFPSSPQDQFVVTPRGFAYTGPLVPGEGTGRVIVTYSLAYEEGMTFERQGTFDVEAVTLLVPAGSGPKIEAEGAVYEGARTVGRGEVFDVYRMGPLVAGKALRISLSGEPVAAMGGTGAEVSEPTGPRQNVLLGVAALGAALIVVGLWWWRRIASEPDESLPTEAADFDDVD